MGIVNVTFGDMVHVYDKGTDRKFMVERDAEGRTQFRRMELCEGCGENDALEFEYYGRFLCPRCVERALQYIAYSAALNHLMANDDELAKGLSILQQIDADNAGSTIQFVDSHSSAMDQMWGESDSEVRTICHEISEAIYNVLVARTLIDRT